MKLDVIAKDQDFAGISGFGQMTDGVIGAGRFTLRPVRKSDSGLFAMYAGDRRVAEATASLTSGEAALPRWAWAPHTS